MKHVFVTLPNESCIASSVFLDGFATLTVLDERGNSHTIQAKREEVVKALRDLADQIEKAVP